MLTRIVNKRKLSTGVHISTLMTAKDSNCDSQMDTWAAKPRFQTSVLLIASAVPLTPTRLGALQKGRTEPCVSRQPPRSESQMNPVLRKWAAQTCRTVCSHSAAQPGPLIAIPGPLEIGKRGVGVLALLGIHDAESLGPPKARLGWPSPSASPRVRWHSGSLVLESLIRPNRVTSAASRSISPVSMNSSSQRMQVRALGCIQSFVMPFPTFGSRARTSSGHRKCTLKDASDNSAQAASQRFVLPAEPASVVRGGVSRSRKPAWSGTVSRGRGRDRARPRPALRPDFRAANSLATARQSSGLTPVCSARVT